MIIGALAQMILIRGRRGIDWGMALIAGLAGSFVGGLLASLIAGDGLKLRLSGIIGSLVGAVIITAIWVAAKNRAKAKEKAAEAAVPNYNKGKSQHSGTSKKKRRK